MRLANQLDHILFQASKGRILRFLVIADPELSGREIANAVGLSHVNVHTALKDLNRHGIVRMRRAGKSILYSLNSKNVLVNKMLIPLFKKEARLGSMLVERISEYLKKPAPRSIVLFGSFASGRERSDSDIDVLVIASKREDIPILEEGLVKAEIGISTGFGNRLAPIVMDEMEFKKRFKNKDKLIRNVVRDGKVIFGALINDLITFND